MSDSSEIVMLEPDPDWQPFKDLPRADPAIVKAWLEDECVPYTEYDRARDIAACRRADYWAALAPPVP